MRDAQETTMPVFVVGMNGSGTTLLLDCLDSHPLLYGFPRETKIIPFLLRSAERYGDLEHDANFRRYWGAVSGSGEIRRANGGIPPPLPEDWQSYPRNAASPIDGIFRQFARQAGKPHWCEKTPMHGLHIRTLAEFFPRARFVHVIRDGRACAASFHRRWKYRPLNTVYRWKRVVRETRRQGRQYAHRYHEVRYEALVGDPRSELKAVCAFLNLPFTDSILIPSRSRPRTIGNRETSAIGADYRYWRGYFSPRVIERMDEIAGSLLHELGYPTERPQGDSDPNPLLRRYWLASDYLRRGFQEAASAWRSGGREVWGYYFRYLRDAIRQRRTSGY